MSDNFRKSLASCLELLAKNELLFQAGPMYSLDASASFKKVARRSMSYKEVYDSGVENQDFNLMLFDQSFFQFTEVKSESDVRLAYYPNPYQFVNYRSQKKEALELLECGELSLSDYEQLVSEEDFTCDIPVIRYDLSLKQHCEKYHPAAHFHIGFFAENRWPVRRVLTPYAFLLKILMHYYPKVWFNVGDRGDDNNWLDLAYRNELTSCNILQQDFFKQEEVERLHFV